MDASATCLFPSPVLTCLSDKKNSNGTSTRTDIIPVLQRISAALNGCLPIPEAAFVMTCKRIQTVLLLSVGQSTTSLQQIALVDVVEGAVIAFMLRVFPSIIKKFPQPTVSWLSSPVSLISLLRAVDIHICKYADFTLQLRMAAIYQLLRDNEQVAMMVFSLLTDPNATTQLYPLESDSTFPEFFTRSTSGVSQMSPQMYCQEHQQLEFTVPVFLSCQDTSELLHQSLPGATMSAHSQLLPPLSRSYSTPNIHMNLLSEVISLSVQGSPPVQSTGNEQGFLQDTTRTLSPSLFTPDPDARTPTMETGTPTCLAAPDSSELQQVKASSFSSPLSDAPLPRAQSSSPFSLQTFTVLNNPFFNTFDTATEALSPKRKLPCTPDSPRSRYFRMQTLGHPVDAGSMFATDVALPLPTKPEAAENKEKNGVPTTLVKKTQGHPKADRESARRKKAPSTQSVNKENLEVEE